MLRLRRTGQAERSAREILVEEHDQPEEKFTFWPRWVYVSNKAADGREHLALGINV
jgi:hypothetical protein